MGGDEGPTTSRSIPEGGPDRHPGSGPPDPLPPFPFSSLPSSRWSPLDRPVALRTLPFLFTSVLLGTRGLLSPICRTLGPWSRGSERVGTVQDQRMTTRSTLRGTRRRRSSLLSSCPLDGVGGALDSSPNFLYYIPPRVGALTLRQPFLFISYSTVYSRRARVFTTPSSTEIGWTDGPPSLHPLRDVWLVDLRRTGTKGFLDSTTSHRSPPPVLRNGEGRIGGRTQGSGRVGVRR